MKHLFRKYYFLLLLPLFGFSNVTDLQIHLQTEQISVVHTNQTNEKVCLLFQDVSQENNKFKSEVPQQLRFELTKHEVVEDSLDIDKKASDCSFGFLGSSYFFLKVYTNFYKCKRPITDFYSFNTVQEPLYILYKVFRL